MYNYFVENQIFIVSGAGASFAENDFPQLEKTQNRYQTAPKRVTKRDPNGANTDQKTWCRPNLRGCLQISSAEIRVQVLRYLSEIGKLAGWVPKPSFLESKSLAQGKAINSSYI